MNDSKFKNCSAKTSEISCLQQKIKFDVNKPKYGNCGKQPKKSIFLVKINIIWNDWPVKEHERKKKLKSRKLQEGNFYLRTWIKQILEIVKFMWLIILI